MIRFLKQYNIELHYDIKSGYEIVGEAVKKRAIFFMLFPQILNHYQNRKILTEYEDEVISILSKLRHIEEELYTEYVSGILPTLALFMATLPNQHDTLNFADMDEEEIVLMRPSVFGFDALQGCHFREDKWKQATTVQFHKSL